MTPPHHRPAPLLVASALLAACGASEAPPSAPAPTPTPPPVAAPPAPGAPAAPGASAIKPKEPEAGRPLPPIAFDSKGRRDPFAPVSLAAEHKGITLTAAKLVGIVQGRPGLMALVEGPDGIGYILKTGDALGNGRVTAITAASVTFAVAAQPGQGPTTVTLRLPLD